MNLEQYFLESARTSSVSSDHKHQVLHGAMGICTEVIEFHKSFEEGDEKNVRQEIGDIFWYVAETCRGIGITMNDLDFNLEVSMNSVDTLVEKAGDLLDQAKRIIFYHTDINKEKINDLLNVICTELNAIIDDYGYDLEELLEQNIQKLRIRFPKAFDAERAVNRDVAKEEKVFN